MLLISFYLLIHLFAYLSLFSHCLKILGKEFSSTGLRTSNYHQLSCLKRNILKNWRLRKVKYAFWFSLGFFFFFFFFNILIVISTYRLDSSYSIKSKIESNTFINFKLYLNFFVYDI